MPTYQSKRDLIAKMKLIPVQDLIEGRSLLLIDDSIVRAPRRGRRPNSFMPPARRRSISAPPAPPLLFGCKYLNFSRSRSEMELIARQVICELEGTDDVSTETVKEYANPDSEKYQKMVDMICEKLHFTSLRYHRLDDMIESVGIEPEKLCTYCWNGEE